MRRVLYYLSGLVLACATGPGAPQQDSSSAPAVAVAPPAPSDSIKLGEVTFSGSLRSRFYVWDWFQPAAGQNQYQYSGNLLRLNFAEKFSTWDWNVELSVPILLGLPRAATTAAPQGPLGLGFNYYSANGNQRNTAMIFARQFYARLDRLGGREGQTLQIGRFTFLDGSELAPRNATLATVKSARVSQRLLGDFGWSDVGRSFDGIHYSLNMPSANLTLVAAVPTRGVFQTDGWGWNQAAFAYGAYTRQWGKGQHSADTRLFFLEYNDWRPVLKTDNRPLAVRQADAASIRIDTFGGHTLHAFTTGSGTFDALAWGAVQTGRWGTQMQRSYELDFEAGWQPGIAPRVKPWLRFGFTKGSGDGDPNDRTHSTFFQVLPTPRPYARFPFFNMMNTEDLMGSLMRLHCELQRGA